VGFNGKHLGWYRNGAIHDHDGEVVVAPARAFSSKSPLTAPTRGFRQFKPFKAFKEFKPFKPLFSNVWSDVPATVFLRAGVR
jgi:hypothetical protein